MLIRRQNPWLVASGFTVIEVLITLAVVSIASLAIAGLISNMSREMRATNQKNDANDLHSRAATVLSYLPVCDCQLSVNASTFDSTASQPVSNVSKILSSCAATADTLMVANSVVPGSHSLLTVDQIQIANIESLGTPDIYRGIIRVTYKPDNLIRALKGFDMEIRFETDPLSPANQKKIVKCDAIGGTSTPPTTSTPVAITGTCPSGQYLSGVLNGVVQCSPLPTPTLASISCPADQYLTGINNGVPQCSPMNTKSCPPGQYLYAQSSGGFDCAPLQTPTPTTPLPWSLSNPGPGCSGNNCVAGDYGTCTGHNCMTNGNFCKGSGCSACAVGATCNGANCCFGPTCPGCPP